MLSPLLVTFPFSHIQRPMFEQKKTISLLALLTLVLLASIHRLQHRSFQHDDDLNKTTATVVPSNIKTCSDESESQTISRINRDSPPSADTIKDILKEERMIVNSTDGLDSHLDEVDDIAKFYELAYAFVAAFQRNDIPIFLGFGSHLGARRHHGEFYKGTHVPFI